ncbi:MAG: hypothetical protein IJ389_06145 [Clostridia bacterium]|nr:hypothetical protein [Clostridia bacterium]
MKRFTCVVVLIGLSVMGIVGACEIYSIVKNISRNANAFYAVEEVDYAGVKYNEKQLNDAKSAAKRILDSSIKMQIADVSSNGNVMVCYTKNIYMELDSNSLCPVFMFYECEAGKKKYKDEQLMAIATTFALRNLPRGVKGQGSYFEKISDEKGIVSYRAVFGDKRSVVSLRADTGSVVFYDGHELFDV